MLNILRRSMSFGIVPVLILAGSSASGQSVQREMVVSVLDRDGAPAAGLTPSDFIVREDGVVREVLRVSQDPVERQIALLVDTSQAAGQSIGDFRRAARSFVENMSDGNKISIIAFGERPQILAEASSSLKSLQDGVNALFSYQQSASYLINAVSETTQGFERTGARRPVIVVMTTLGIDYSDRDARPTISRLQKAGVAMYTMVINDLRRAATAAGQGGLGRGELQDRLRERDLLLDQGPKLSGGRRRDLQSSMGSARALQDLANDLRSQYVIVYSRPNTLIQPERIEVEVNRDDLDARGTPIAVND